MLYCVQMDVRVPHDVDTAHVERLKVAEKDRAGDLQRAGAWVHLWRVQAVTPTSASSTWQIMMRCTPFLPPCRCSRSWTLW